MSHVFQSLWVHVTWATKNRQPWLTAKLKPLVFNQIRHIAEKDNIHLDFLNGIYDHVHCLLSLRTTDRLDLVMQQLKGKSAHWVNEQQLTDFTFGWQNGYGAFSVSPSHVERVRNYIRNQEKHHQEQDYWQEMEMLEKMARVS
ncbi:IS200/IS605 family transposase [Hymenobacter psychrophilus]|uniref:REP element-mobilizing transposase RayT n=1 Tax=Hymenobacter psychrophilus TaxID=651662 RepID=A0A1H3JND4_9BACT|nr:IS200/IS605 family transposase [Hymenobacter psychrophilus]SDY40888.1 REP element-mobilizing transposase RayT [Hymenobacter psychrophilus]